LLACCFITLKFPGLSLPVKTWFLQKKAKKKSLPSVYHLVSIKGQSKKTKFFYKLQASLPYRVW
jgi:hypothetical protein